MANASLFSPEKPHFFHPLLPGFESHLKIPVKFFSKHIEGKHEGKHVKLRLDASKKTWIVKMEGHKLTNGWKEFVEAHDLRVGDFVVFRHEGDMLFHVTALGPSCCEIQYATSRSHDEDEESDEIGESSRKKKKIVENVKSESDQSLSDLNRFSQSVTASNLSRDTVSVPMEFAKRNSLNKGRQEIVLMNEEGKSWESKLKSILSSRVYIVRGWTSFCTANRLEVGDSCTFKLLRNTEKPVFRLCSRTKAERNKNIQSPEENRFVKLTPTPNSLDLGKQCISSDEYGADEDDTWDKYSDSKNIVSKKKKPRTEAESSTENSYLVTHVTSSNLSRDRLCLLRGFARSNGLNKRCCEIDLMNQHGKSWTLGLRYNTTTDQACICGGWRNFCFANGLEAGSFYKFQLVQNGTRPLLRLCSDTTPEGNCSKANGKDNLSGKPSSEYSESASTKQNKFLTITFKPYMLNSGQLRLPRAFASENGIKKAGEITLMDKNGVKWPSYLVSVNEQQGGFYMAKGWRSFIAANALKAGETFTLEYVRGEGTTPVLKFCSKAKVKIEQAPFDGSGWTGKASGVEEEMETRAQKRARDSVGGPSRRTLASNKSSADAKKLDIETPVQKRARVSVDGGPSRVTRASNKSSADPGNLQLKQPLQPCSISDQVTKVKQSVVDTLTCVRLFRSELEIKEQNLEVSLLEIDALGEKIMGIGKFFNVNQV